MIKTHREKKIANVVFKCEGRYISLLDRSFEFTTIPGAKVALRAAIKKSIGNLQRFYGYGKIINVEVYLPGKTTPFMGTNSFTRLSLRWMKCWLLR